MGCTSWGSAIRAYRDLIRLEDPFPLNKGPKTGALVEAKVGKGRWIYIGLGLWRQLPAGADGAYQLMANLLSLGSPRMRFAPEYVSCVLNENFEDAKAEFLSPLMAIHYAHLVMLAEQGIVRQPGCPRDPHGAGRQSTSTRFARSATTAAAKTCSSTSSA